MIISEKIIQNVFHHEAIHIFQHSRFILNRSLNIKNNPKDIVI
jgi:hypothetical protein